MATTLKGNCHCRAVSYTVTLDDPIESLNATACNCSLCRRKQTRWTFIPSDKFVFDSGEDSLKAYEWGEKRVKYFFCPSCGVSTTAKSDVFPTMKGKIGVNAWTFDDLDVSKLNITEFNGRDNIPGPHKEDPKRYP